MFEVSLIKVPELEKMTGIEVFDLMGNARHIAGRYWMMEGNHESLRANVELMDEGITEGHGDINDCDIEYDFVDHSVEVFPSFEKEIREAPRSWEMLPNY